LASPLKAFSLVQVLFTLLDESYAGIHYASLTALHEPVSYPDPDVLDVIDEDDWSYIDAVDMRSRLREMCREPSLNGPFKPKGSHSAA
jgi:hypothetical protein